MAHGKRTAGAVTGAAAGAAAGPVGALIGGAAGYGLASVDSLLGKKKKKPVAKPSILPAVLIGGAGVVAAGLVIYFALRR